MPLNQPSGIRRSFTLLMRRLCAVAQIRGTNCKRLCETPVVKDSGGRFGFKLISAVSSKSDMRFHFIKNASTPNYLFSFYKNYGPTN